MAATQIKGSGWPRRTSQTNFDAKFIANQSITINRTINL